MAYATVEEVVRSGASHPIPHIPLIENRNWFVDEASVSTVPSTDLTEEEIPTKNNTCP